MRLYNPAPPLRKPTPSPWHIGSILSPVVSIGSSSGKGRKSSWIGSSKTASSSSTGTPTNSTAGAAGTAAIYSAAVKACLATTSTCSELNFTEEETKNVVSTTTNSTTSSRSSSNHNKTKKNDGKNKNDEQRMKANSSTPATSINNNKNNSNNNNNGKQQEIRSRLVQRSHSYMERKKKTTKSLFGPLIQPTRSASACTHNEFMSSNSIFTSDPQAEGRGGGGSITGTDSLIDEFGSSFFTHDTDEEAQAVSNEWGGLFMSRKISVMNNSNSNGKKNNSKTANTTMASSSNDSIWSYSYNPFRTLLGSSSTSQLTIPPTSPAGGQSTTMTSDSSIWSNTAASTTMHLTETVQACSDLCEMFLDPSSVNRRQQQQQQQQKKTNSQQNQSSSNFVNSSRTTTSTNTTTTRKPSSSSDPRLLSKANTTSTTTTGTCSFNPSIPITSSKSATTSLRQSSIKDGRMESRDDNDNGSEYSSDSIPLPHCPSIDELCVSVNKSYPVRLLRVTARGLCRA